MFSFQGHCYASLHEVPPAILYGFIHHAALTETIAYVNGHPLFWEEHYLRLMASMRILRMEIPLSFTPEQLLSDAATLCLALKQPKFTGHIQLRVTKADSPNNQNPIPSTIYAIEAFEKEHPFLYRREQLPIDLYKDHYLLPGMYASLESSFIKWRNMAWTYVYENGYCDGIVLNEKKQVVETLNGPLFLVKGNQITTPALGIGNRKGIYRQQLISVIQQKTEFELIETEISPFALQKSDEIIVLKDACGLNSISQYRKKVFGDRVSKQLWDLFSAHLKGNA